MMLTDSTPEGRIAYAAMFRDAVKHVIGREIRELSPAEIEGEVWKQEPGFFSQEEMAKLDANLPLERQKEMIIYAELLGMMERPTSGLDEQQVIAMGGGYGTYDDLFPREKTVDERTAEAETARELDTFNERKIVRDLQLDVLGELEDGSIKVYSVFHRKSRLFRSAREIDYSTLMQLCGPPAKQFLIDGAGDPPPDTYLVKDAQRAIAMLSGYQRIGEQTELGVGCWSGQNEDGSEHDSVVIIGAGEAAEWDPARGTLERILHPRCRGRILDFDSAASQWYDFDTLKKYIEACDVEFCRAAFAACEKLFSQWKWIHKETPLILTGLLAASWVQTLWAWRPQVAITGATNAGKSILFDTIAAMFGRLAEQTSDSSAAGLRQTIRTSAKIPLCDEIDSSPHQKDILEMVRRSGRGDRTVRGTAGQRAQGFLLRHIFWLAGIGINFKREPDRNRYAFLELDKPVGEDRGKQELPRQAELADLGMRVLAMAIRHVTPAKALAVKLKEERIPGVDDRAIESYAVPVAMMATIGSYSYDESVQLMKALLHGLFEEHTVQADENDLLQAILSAHVYSSKESYAVSQLLDIVIHNKAGVDGARDALAKVGIGVTVFPSRQPSDGKQFDKSLLGQRSLAIHCQAVSDHLLRNSIWKDQPVSQILKRLPKTANRVTTKIGGQCVKAVMIHLDWLLSGVLDDAPASEGEPNP